MTKQTILKKAIEKAVKNGWKPPIKDGKMYLGVKRLGDKPWFGLVFCSRRKYSRLKLEDCRTGTVVDPKHFIFSHDFAKAFFGESWVEVKHKLTTIDSLHGVKLVTKEEVGQIKEWQYHLQQMVLEKDPIKYLEKFI